MLAAPLGTPRSFLVKPGRRVIPIHGMPLAWYKDAECRSAVRAIAMCLVSLVLLVGFDITGSWAGYVAIVLTTGAMLSAVFWLYRRITHPLRPPIIPAITKRGVNHKMQGVS